MRILPGLLLAGAASVAVAGTAVAAPIDNPLLTPAPTAGAVYVATNHNNTSDPSEPANEIVAYRRGRDGRLTIAKRYATGGQGSGPSQRFAGDGLGAGNSVQVSDNRRFLFVTNAGSDTVTVFRVLRHGGLIRADVVPTGDGSQSHRFPNSVAQHGNLVYVLNSADQGSITGFRLTQLGHLRPLAGSTRGIAANQSRFTPDPAANPTQVSFTPDGRRLVVSIKDGPVAGLLPGFTPSGPGRVLTFSVKAGGRPSATFARTDFANRGPFGFSFDRRGNVLIAEFLGGGFETINGKMTTTGSAGSYRIAADGTLKPITSAVGDHQIDTCWIVNNGRFAYGTNYGSGTVSSWSVSADGSLKLLSSVAGKTDDPGNEQGSTPLDPRISRDGKTLYAVLPGAGRLAAWTINADGSLTKIGEYGGLPQTVDGDHGPTDFSALGSPAGIDVL
jgi:6-phosphogluconolactonase